MHEILELFSNKFTEVPLWQEETPQAQFWKMLHVQNTIAVISSNHKIDVPYRRGINLLLMGFPLRKAPFPRMAVKSCIPKGKIY